MRISALIKCELVRLKSANCCLKKIWMLFSKLMRFMWEKYELVHLENVTKNNESRNAFWKRFFEKFAFWFTIVHFFLKFKKTYPGSFGTSSVPCIAWAIFGVTLVSIDSMFSVWYEWIFFGNGKGRKIACMPVELFLSRNHRS